MSDHNAMSARAKSPGHPTDRQVRFGSTTGPSGSEWPRGDTTMSLRERWNAVMMPNYGTPPIAIDHGSGVRVWDDSGQAYLDFVRSHS